MSILALLMDFGTEGRGKKGRGCVYCWAWSRAPLGDALGDSHGDGRG